MRPGHWLPFGTLVFLLAACSSRGGEALFTGEEPPVDFDERDAAADDEAPGDDEADAGHDDETPDADVDDDAGEDAGDGASEADDDVGELPPVAISCGDATCTTPDQYCCRPPGGNINIPGVSVSCKAAGEECRFGVGPVGTDGVPQHCSAHEHCGGGECCAIRAPGQNQSRYESVECVLQCEGNDVEVCDPDNPQCNNGGTCVASTLARGLYVCRT